MKNIENIEEYFKNKPAQKEIYNWLLTQPNGCVGAVRTNQRARGFQNERSVASSECLEPLYALVKNGFVSAEKETIASGQSVCRYRAVK